jgi:Ran-binding protein 9/10
MIVLDDIRKADVSILYPPMSETQLIQKLIEQYLYHEGYVGSATAFAREVRQENAALHGEQDTDEEMQREDTDASIRHGESPPCADDV